MHYKYIHLQSISFRPYSIGMAGLREGARKGNNRFIRWMAYLSERERERDASIELLHSVIYFEIYKGSEPSLLCQAWERDG